MFLFIILFVRRTCFARTMDVLIRNENEFILLLNLSCGILFIVEFAVVTRSQGEGFSLPIYVSL
jgi:hypothetical protein